MYCSEFAVAETDKAWPWTGNLPGTTYRTPWPDEANVCNLVINAGDISTNGLGNQRPSLQVFQFSQYIQSPNENKQNKLNLLHPNSVQPIGI